MKDLLLRHPKTTVVWAHIGLGRVVRPTQDEPTADRADRNPAYQQIIEQLLSDPRLSHLYFDISWDAVAKYVVQTPEIERRVVEVFNRYPDRFLFGTDNVAPPDQAAQLRVYELWAPIWARLTPEASVKIRKGNYERIFDAARVSVRAWENANVK